MSDILKDEQVKPMDKAVWNIEHVIKFSNSDHLKYHGKNIKFFDYFITYFIFIIFLIFLIFMLFLFFILPLIYLFGNICKKVK